jgi:hypothetical protein
MSEFYGVSVVDLLDTDPRRHNLTDGLARLVRRLDRAEDVKAVRAMVELLLSKRVPGP